MVGHARSLQPTSPTQLARVEDRISFVYLDRAKIARSATGVVAFTSTEQTGPVAVPLPAAAIAVIMLGPGTSISSPAIETLARCGAVVLSVGVEGVRTHAWSYATTSSSKWAQAQARLWADPGSRVEVARQMYLRRFEEPPPGELTLARLRGAEGARMRALYKAMAKKYRTPDFKRRFDPADFEASDPVNQALSAANACLYGLCLAGIASIGALPQLGFVHTGTTASFVHDIADLYKAELTVPNAFLLARTADPGSAARRVMRRTFRETRLVQRVVADVMELLGPGLDEAVQEGSNRLLDENGTVEGGRNWAQIVGVDPPQPATTFGDWDPEVWPDEDGPPFALDEDAFEDGKDGMNDPR